MRSLVTILNALVDRGRAGKPIDRLYRHLSRMDLLVDSYCRIGKNKGALTPGVTPETVDGTSLKKLERIAEVLRNDRWSWQPARRTYIPKAKGGQRPLGLPTWSDKLVQEALRRLLEAYYEPRFSDSSFGFRPRLGCHDALWKVKTWVGTKWFIELDIKGCFDNIDHTVLLNILARDIQDAKFLRLIAGLLEAGYLEDWAYHRTLSGTPQGGVVSPLLANIYLTELDRWVENHLLPKYTKGHGRRQNPEYRRLRATAQRVEKAGDKQRRWELLKESRKHPFGDPSDPDFRRLGYVRYADDALLGFVGPKEEALAIKGEISAFLRTELKLEMSEEKTLVTHAATEYARFLGYNVKTLHSPTRRLVNGKIGLFVPRDKLRAKCQRYMEGGKPERLPPLIVCSDYEIVRHYEAVFRGLYNYYALAHNVSGEMAWLGWVLSTSMLKTFANKYRTTVTRMARKLKRRDPEVGTYFEVTVPRDGKPPLVATFGKFRCVKQDRPIPRMRDALMLILPARNDLVDRLLAEECELCGSSEEVEVHHIRKMKDLFNARSPRPVWMEVMIGRRRKTISVCRSCHQDIHDGRYDGPKLS